MILATCAHPKGSTLGAWQCLAKRRCLATPVRDIRHGSIALTSVHVRTAVPPDQTVHACQPRTLSRIFCSSAARTSCWRHQHSAGTAAASMHTVRAEPPSTRAHLVPHLLLLGCLNVRHLGHGVHAHAGAVNLDLWFMGSWVHGFMGGRPRRSRNAHAGTAPSRSATGRAAIPAAATALPLSKVTHLVCVHGSVGHQDVGVLHSLGLQ